MHNNNSTIHNNIKNVQKKTICATFKLHNLNLLNLLKQMKFTELEFQEKQSLGFNLS